MFNYKDYLKNLWLPYHNGFDEPIILPIKNAKGVFLQTFDGQKIIDGISSWWCASHGHNNKHINKAIKNQLKNFSHTMFGNCANKPAYVLAQKLSNLVGLNRVFYAESGSIAVEVAIKIAIQYWYNKGEVGKNKIVYFENSYHGETFGAMSVSSGFGNFNETFSGVLPQNFKCSLEEKTFEEFIEKNHSSIAAVIIEPLVQAAGGFKFYSNEVLQNICNIAKKYNLLFIADEIMTGFFKTGGKNLFAFANANINPDIVCVGKALTGGALPLAATLVKEDIYQQFVSQNSQKTLMHGGTFMANPLACSTGLASIELFEKINYCKKVFEIEAFLKENLKQHSKIKEIRVKGSIGVLELKESSPKLINKLRQKFMYEQKVLIRPFSNVIYLMPPFIIKQKQLEKLINSIYKVLDEL